MGYEAVYRSLTETFPQIDARALKAVAIEHPKDANEAAAVVFSEILPLFFPNLADTSTQPENKTPANVPDKERVMQNGASTGSETGASSTGTAPLAVDCDLETRATPITVLLSNRNQLESVIPNGDLDIQSKSKTGLSGLFVPGVVSSDPPPFVQAETKLTSDDLQGVEFHVTGNQTEASTSGDSEDAVHKLVYPADNLVITEKSPRLQIVFGSFNDQNKTSSGSLAVENGDPELAGSNLVDETSNGSLVVENGDPELGGAFSSSSVVSRSTNGSNILHLEEIIEDAKSNKRTLLIVMESIMNLMREVELQEKDAIKAQEDASRGGFDTLDKVEKQKEVLEYAKEANDMMAGEVYGERSILTTEVKELENRLLNLSEERDKSLSVLDEMRGVLETRRAAALEIKNAAEQEKQEKEASARKAYAEQEAMMEKVLQESKLLQQEDEENSKLREFLMDRGRIVDSLQGEISVICQDIRHLKEKFDNRVPLSLSISSSQTSCKLASSASSMKSLLLEKKPLEASYETMDASSNNEMSVKAMVKKGKDERKELVEDGWDIFDKETEL